MREKKRKSMDELIRQLKHERDELKLKIHLGKLEVKDEWGELQDKLAALENRFRPVGEAAGETAEDVWESLKLLGGEIRDGFKRIRKSL
jgi:hypothetical protein